MGGRQRPEAFHHHAQRPRSVHGRVGKENTAVSTRKQHLAALRHYFDGLVTRHAMVLNPALSVRGERYETVEGKTPEITVDGARTLLKSIKVQDDEEGKPLLVGLRDRAVGLETSPKRPQLRDIGCWSVKLSNDG